MYRLTHYGRSRRPLPGVPWRDLTDEEYATVVKNHPGMEEQDYFFKAEEEIYGASDTGPRKPRQLNPVADSLEPVEAEEQADG